MGARMGNSLLIRSPLPAPPPESAAATWVLSLPPKILATALDPSVSSTWSTLTPPSSRPLAAWLPAAFSMLAAWPGSDAFCRRPPTRSGTSVWTASVTSPSSAPRRRAMSPVGIWLKSSSRPAIGSPSPSKWVEPARDSSPGVEALQPFGRQRHTCGGQALQQRVAECGGGGEHAAEVGQLVAVQRQRQPAFAEQHRRRLVPGVALLRHRRPVAGTAGGRGVGLDRVVPLLAGLFA